MSVLRLLCVAVLLSGCVSWPWKKKRKMEPSPPVAMQIGRVALVDPDQHFALIEATGARAPVAGTVLRAYSGGAVSAELRATGVKKRPFLVADLVSGNPAKGDVIVQPPEQEETPRASTPAPAPKPKSRGWLGLFRFGK